MKKLVNRLVNDVKENQMKYILKAMLLILIFSSITFNMNNALMIFIVIVALIVFVFMFVDFLWSLLSKYIIR